MTRWGRFLCWLFREHRAVWQVRVRPRRTVQVCTRCGELLTDDPWDKDRDGPRRMA